MSEEKSPLRMASVGKLKRPFEVALGAERIRRGVEFRIPEKLEEGSMIVVASRPGGDVHLRLFAAELGRINAALYLKFLDRIDGGLE
jgi:hypothetical protein